MRLRIALLLAAAAGAACATGLGAPGGLKRGAIIRATGKAEINPQIPVSPRQRAVKDAESRALEAAVELHMPHDLLARNAAAIQDRIFDRPRDYIRSRKVLKTWKEPAYAKASIEAAVDFAAIERQLRAIGLFKSIESGAHVQIDLAGLAGCADIEGFKKILESYPGVGDYVVDRCDGSRAQIEAAVQGLSSTDLASGLVQQAGLDARPGPVANSITVNLEAPSASAP